MDKIDLAGSVIDLRKCKALCIFLSNRRTFALSAILSPNQVCAIQTCYEIFATNTNIELIPMG